MIGASTAREMRSPARLAGLRLETLEATTGIEPVMKVLQTSALPLGYVAQLHPEDWMLRPQSEMNQMVPRMRLELIRP